MRPFAVPICLTAATLIVLWGVGLGTFPLGIPGEWQWSRVAPSEPLGLAIVPVLIAAGLYVGFVCLGDRTIERCGRWGVAAWVCGLTWAGFAWLWTAQESAPENLQLSKAVWILYYRGSSGYFSEAREGAEDLTRYLASYERKMKEGDVLHIGTHPPGLIVAVRGLIGLCRAMPRLVDGLEAVEPASVRSAFEELKKREPLSRTDRAALWLAALLVQVGVALTVIPLFRLIGLSCSRRATWRATAFWPTIPALALFLPKSDCLFPLLATAFLWFWLEGLGRSSRWSCALAGLVFWLSLSLSLAFLPVGLIALLAGFWNLRHAAPADRSATVRQSDRAPSSAAAERTSVRHAFRQMIPAAAAAAVGFAVPLVAAWCIAGINLINVWTMNFHNHAGFYQQFPRTYWKWLLVNPIEFGVAAGAPIVVLAIWSMTRLSCRPSQHVWGPAWAWLVTFVLLWISGKNMGEAARLWIFLMPFPVWISGPLFEPLNRRTANDSRQPGELIDSVADSSLPASTWIVALGAQLVATAFIVTQVGGFHQPEAVPVAATLQPP